MQILRAVDPHFRMGTTTNHRMTRLATRGGTYLHMLLYLAELLTGLGGPTGTFNIGIGKRPRDAIFALVSITVLGFCSGIRVVSMCQMIDTPMLRPL